MYEPLWLNHIGDCRIHLREVYEEQPEYPRIASSLDKCLGRLPLNSSDRVSYPNAKVERSWLTNQFRKYLEPKKELRFIHCGQLGVYCKRAPRPSQLN